MEDKNKIYFLESELTSVAHEVIIITTGNSNEQQDKVAANVIPEDPQQIFVEEEETSEGMEEGENEVQEQEEVLEYEVVEHEGELFIKIDDFNYVDFESFQNGWWQNPQEHEDIVINIV